MSNCRSTALSQSSASSGSLVWENVGGCPFINSPHLSIGGAWCGLFNTLWAIVCNNWVYVIKACSIDGELDGGGLELVGFLPAPCEALLVATICFQHVWIRTQSFITSLIVTSRDDKIGLMAIETREHQPPEITNTSKRNARMYETSSYKSFNLATPLKKRSTRGHQKDSLHLLLDELISTKTL